MCESEAVGLEITSAVSVSEHYDSFVFDTDKSRSGEADRCYFFDANGGELRGLVFTDSTQNVMYVRYKS